MDKDKRLLSTLLLLVATGLSITAASADSEASLSASSESSSQASSEAHWGGHSEAQWGGWHSEAPWGGWSSMAQSGASSQSGFGGNGYGRGRGRYYNPWQYPRVNMRRMPGMPPQVGPPPPDSRYATLDRLNQDTAAEVYHEIKLGSEPTSDFVKTYGSTPAPQTISTSDQSSAGWTPYNSSAATTGGYRASYSMARPNGTIDTYRKNAGRTISP